MSTTTQVPPNGRAVSPTVGATANQTNIKTVSVEYDRKSFAVTVAPIDVDKGSTVRFSNSEGKVRIVFLSPTGKETDTVLDSATCVLSIGGIYHFKCFFTPNGSSKEIESPTGGALGVVPPRP